MNGYDDHVRAYLAYCRRAAAELRLRGSALDARYHPTEAGVVRMIPHRGDPAEARKIRETFRDLYGKTTRTETAA